MTNKLVLTGAAVTLLLSTLAAHAEPLDVKLGLWEMTYTTQMNGMLIPDSVLQGMSPEQRARFEAVMKKRQEQGPQNQTHKTCLTQEQLNHAFDKKDEAGNEHCTHTTLTATSTVQEYRIECTGSVPHSGVIRVEALSRESVKSTIKMSSGHGTVNSQLSGRWLAADCGAVH